MGKTIREEVFEVVKELPGTTSGDVVALMPHVHKQTVYSSLDALRVRGEIRQERPYAGGHVTWFANATVTPPPPKRRKITPDGVTTVSSPEVAQAHYQSTIDRLQARIAELEAWKADAIQRYPDLAIDPMLKKARDIVAQELRDSGDKDLAEKAIAGQLDTKLPVRLVLKMLEGVE